MDFWKKQLAALEASNEKARQTRFAREQRKIYRTAAQRRRTKLFGACLIASYAAIGLVAVGGFKGVAFIGKMTMVTVLTAALMDVDLDARDRHLAVDGMLSALDEKSGTSIRAVSSGYSDVSSKRISLGVLLEDRDGAVITALQDESPLRKAGLEVGDKIVWILDRGVESDFERTRKITQLFELVSDYKEPISIGVLRGDEELTFEVVLEPWVPSLVYDLGVRNGVSHIAIPAFRAGMSQAVEDMLRAQMEEGPVHAVMIDLRGNGGGNAIEVKEMAGLFVPDGTVISRLSGRRVMVKEKRTDREEVFPQIERIAVIQDERSASASEEFAAFVKDHDLGPIGGTRSYGKGSMQAHLSNRLVEPFKITIAHFTGPEGTEIDGVGIAPDREVTQDAQGHYDWAGLVEALRAELAGISG